MSDEENRLISLIAANPEDLQARFDLAFYYQNEGRYQESRKAYEQLLSIREDIAAAHNNLGNVLSAQGLWDEAKAALNRVLELDPDSFDGLMNMGNVLSEAGDVVQAERYFRRALQRRPDSSTVLYNLGNLLQNAFRIDEALECYYEALSIEPDSPVYNNNLGNLLRRKGRLTESVSVFLRAIALEPANDMVWGNLGALCMDMGKIEDAIECSETAIRINSLNSDAFDNLLYTLNYPSGLSEISIFQRHLAWGRRFDRDHYSYPQEVAEQSDIGDRNKDNDYIRIGFVSGDFRQHSVAYFFEPLLSAIDQSRFQVFCYSNIDYRDHVTERIASQCVYKEIFTLSDDASCALIRSDGIDILVDLSGHTAKNRLGLFCLKPSMVQATWLGYPNTTGLSAIDYRFTDAIADPPGAADNLHSETLIRLDHGFLCYQGDDSLALDSVPPVVRKGYVTFGCFNNITKISSEMVFAWTIILEHLPQARLILKSKLFSDENITQELLQKFAHGEINKRIIIMGYADSYESHMLSYKDVDIALDTSPYNGTTTTCEALWMGVPVITYSGGVHRSRVSKSILHRLGLNWLAVDSLEDYIALALELGESKDRLADLRSNLRAKMKQSPLCQPRVLAQNMENAFVQMLGSVDVCHSRDL